MIFHDKTAKAARGKWKGILMELGVSQSFLTGKHGPCPICGGDDRFRFDDKEGRGTSFCNVCGARDGMKLAIDFLGDGFQSVATRIDQIVGNIKPSASIVKREWTEEERSAELRRIYQESLPITPGDVAHRYLASRKVDGLFYPPALRFHPALKDGEGGVRPALLAMIGVPGKKKFVSMHRTFLKPDGSGKADMESPRKMMPGPLPDGACVMLSDYRGGALGVAEGIETALSASALFDMPVWSAINTTMMVKWLPPDGCKEIAIFGDNDKKYGGQSAAYTLAHKLAGKGMFVTVNIPTVEGADWADEYMMGRKTERKDAA